MTGKEEGWIDWHGGENPVPGAVVDAKYFNGMDIPLRAPSEQLCWKRSDAGTGIIAYRDVTPAPANPEPVADKWAPLERLAKYASDGPWPHADFIAAANPAVILELIAAARQQPNREG